MFVALILALGLFGYTGVALSLMALNVIPFLMLATGVDNLFTIIHSYEVRLKLM